jgi:hypothetical protein
VRVHAEHSEQIDLEKALMWFLKADETERSE